MANIRARVDTGKLYFDFTYLGVRCREQTLLDDTAKNRSMLGKTLKKLSAEIEAGVFNLETYFPNSTNIEKINKASQALRARDESRVRRAKGLDPDLPTLKEFAETWYSEREIQWRPATRNFMHRHLHQHVLPAFGEKVVSDITRAEVLAFRSQLGKVATKAASGKLSARTINAHMLVLKTLLGEAAARYQFSSPIERIPALKTQRVAVQPFSLDEVLKIVSVMPPLYKHYVLVRFLTGMRTSEADGLKWKSIDWVRKQILIEGSAGADEGLKNASSHRSIQMNALVQDALKKQFAATLGMSEYVFCNQDGGVLDSSNFNKRVWKEALNVLGLEYRRPYQMRHTAATLWLAAGEAPEWIARQLGHTSTQMLFKTYSRFVPNLTRNDGAAFENLLTTNGFAKALPSVASI